MKYSIALAGVLIALMGPASATEYLTNGGFETGDFSGWDLVDLPNAVDDIVASDNPLLGLHYGAQSGDWYLVNSTLDFSMLSQTFTDTQGQLLTVSGWTIGDEHTPGGLGEISYFFNGVLLGSPTVTGTWTQATFSVTATGSDTFEIDFEDVPSLMGLDSFSVSSGGLSSTRDVPEPSTWAMMLIGLIGLGLFTTPARGSLPARIGSLMGRRA
jgi:PEP-CTERM motif